MCCGCCAKCKRKGYVRTCQGTWKVHRTKRRAANGRPIWESKDAERPLVFVLASRAVKDRP